jgi:quinol monooxygenase YgiN
LLDQAKPYITSFVADSANDAGVKEFILVSWRVNDVDITNHFQLIERFQNQRTFDLHLSAGNTIKFRDSVQSFIGAPYDERVYNTHP